MSETQPESGSEKRAHFPLWVVKGILSVWKPLNLPNIQFPSLEGCAALGELEELSSLRYSQAV